MKQASQIMRDPRILGGTAVFAGTHVPVKTMLDYFSGGQTLDEFLTDFPSVSRDQAVKVLQEIKTQLLLVRPNPSQEVAVDSELREEMRAWDSLSDEAFLNLEDSIE